MYGILKQKNIQIVFHISRNYENIFYFIVCYCLLMNAYFQFQIHDGYISLNAFRNWFYILRSEALGVGLLLTH